MSTAEQAAVDSAWGDTIACVSPRLTPAAIVPPTSFRGAGRLHHSAGVDLSPAAVDAMWAAAVAGVNAEEGLGPAPSDAPPGRSDRFR